MQDFNNTVIPEVCISAGSYYITLTNCHEVTVSDSIRVPNIRVNLERVCMKVTAWEWLYESDCMRVAVLECLYKSGYMRVKVYEWLYESYYIRVIV